MSIVPISLDVLMSTDRLTIAPPILFLGQTVNIQTEVLKWACLEAFWTTNPSGAHKMTDDGCLEQLELYIYTPAAIKLQVTLSPRRMHPTVTPCTPPPPHPTPPATL